MDDLCRKNCEERSYINVRNKTHSDIKHDFHGLRRSDIGGERRMHKSDGSAFLLLGQTLGTAAHRKRLLWLMVSKGSVYGQWATRQEACSDFHFTAEAVPRD